MAGKYITIISGRKTGSSNLIRKCQCIIGILIFYGIVFISDYCISHVTELSLNSNAVSMGKRRYFSGLFCIFLKRKHRAVEHYGTESDRNRSLNQLKIGCVVKVEANRYCIKIRCGTNHGRYQGKCFATRSIPSPIRSAGERSISHTSITAFIIS